MELTPENAVAPQVEVTITQVGRDVHIAVVPPAGHRVPSDVVCVVDVSGSMQGSADLPDEAVGLSRLDVVKHALRTIVNTLGPDDRISLVPFSCGARVALPLTACDDDGKTRATTVLEGLGPGGGTNMWNGMETAMDHAASRDGSRPCTVLLLTDGEPSDSGHVERLEQYLQSRPVAPAVLSTFGFGYSLQSKLLEDLAVLGGGLYSFIPDAGLVGTVFVHSAANLLLRMSPVCQLRITNPAPFSGPAWQSDTHVEVDLGMLLYGQSRDLVVTLDEGDASDCKVDVALQVAGTLVTASGRLQPLDADAAQRCAGQKARQQVAQLVAKARELAAQGQYDAAVEEIKRVADGLQDSADEDEAVADLVKDAEGQVSEAVCKSEWWNKWGRHYLPSLQRAHELQQCNNFKDPGVQRYGGQVFQDLRDLADELFLQLPPPQPSRSVGGYGGAPATVNMAAYMNAAGGCFARGLVALEAGLKPIEKVHAGDVLAGGATVTCVVETRFDTPIEVVDLGDCVVTPWHPVKRGEEWVFPCDVAGAEWRQVPAVYALVLDAQEASFRIGRWDAVALGHGITEGKAAHAFFGSRARVAAALAPCEGLVRGRIVFRPGWLVRGDDGLVCGVDTSLEVLAPPEPVPRATAALSVC